MAKMNRRQKQRLLESFKGKSDNEIADLIRNGRDDFLYSNEWRELKRKVHNKYGYSCMCCGFTPRDKRKSNVDHIKPRKFSQS